MIVAELRVITLGEGTSLEHPVEEALKVLDEKGVTYRVGPIGTAIEAESIEDVFDAVAACHKALRPLAGRIFTEVTVDERLDKEETTESLTRVQK